MKIELERKYCYNVNHTAEISFAALKRKKKQRNSEKEKEEEDVLLL